jgi:hypothetical protein
VTAAPMPIKRACVSRCIWTGCCHLAACDGGPVNDSSHVVAKTTDPVVGCVPFAPEIPSTWIGFCQEAASPEAASPANSSLSARRDARPPFGRLASFIRATGIR